MSLLCTLSGKIKLSVSDTVKPHPRINVHPDMLSRLNIRKENSGNSDMLYF